MSDKKILIALAIIVFIAVGLLINATQTNNSPKSLREQSSIPSHDYIQAINQSKNLVLSSSNVPKPLAQDVSTFDFPSIAYASDLKKNTTIYDSKGEKIETAIQAQANGNGSSIQIARPQQFIPGRYSLVVNQDGKKITQDFLWGVLAINTNKSTYSSSEVAKLAIAVLDETGNMICDADVKLEITDPTGRTSTATIRDKTIVVNPECSQKKYTVNPDYKSSYRVQNPGIYKMDLTATTKNGTYRVVDYFSVENNSAFDVERVTATRIFPYNTYPVSIKITAKKDFSGQIVELTPKSFDISPLADTIAYTTTQINGDTQYILWNVSLKKGQSINIGYTFKTPLKSPDFYLLGPLNFVVGNNIVFQEKRTWQLAIDATYQSTILGTTGLIGYWRLGEPSGTNADDISTANNDGTYVGSPTLGVAGALVGDSNTAVTFTGNPQNVTVANVADFSPGSVTGPVSFELWFKRSTATQDNGLIARPGGATARWFLYVSSGFSCSPTPVGTIVWGGGSTAVTCSNTQITDTTTWHYLVGTYDGTTSGWKIYIDGSDDGAALHTDGTVPGSNTGTVTFALDLASDYWHGTLDEIAIYNVALSAATVTQHYNAGLGIFNDTTGDFMFEGIRMQGVGIR